ncbi:MAG: hydantoinase/oxoprolinase family protein [Methyloligellaceae bacterium]
MRFACDTGGTFTDLIVEDDEGRLTMYKTPTVPSDPVVGVLDALQAAADDRNIALTDLLARGEILIHGTTHAINAIITGNTAKTAFLTTKGHPDVLILREAGRIEPFNFRIPYPTPYVPRALTFQIPERVNSLGDVVSGLDETAVRQTITNLQDLDIEAVAVCLLWSITNPEHELKVGELLDTHLPGVPYTLSHELNPTLREYRRASSTAIDASLKPLMTNYLASLTNRLKDAGFDGRTLVLTSQGGMMEADELASKPIHAINSGPSMAPIAGGRYALMDCEESNAIIADTGGTTYDVSLVRQGRIPRTHETWIGQPFRGHMTGFSSIDIKSVGAGGGSIASVDDGGILHVGPKSAGASPGPVCYGKGGAEPTLTDACLVLGYIDAEYFLGGTIGLDVSAAEQAIQARIAEPLGLNLMESASAIVSVATENMVQAISEITVNQGIDPAEAVLVGGGGAAGLNSVFVARRLGCPTLLFPDTGAGLSAFGALLSDLKSEYRRMFFTTSENFDWEAVNAMLADLRTQGQKFIDGPGKNATQSAIQFSVEARYASQVWEIDVPLKSESFQTDKDLDQVVEDFHRAHEEIFAVKDPDSAVEFVGWNAAVSCKLGSDHMGRLTISSAAPTHEATRNVYFDGIGRIDAKVQMLHELNVNEPQTGPSIIETPYTTIVIDPGTSYHLTEGGNVLVAP